MIRPHPLFTVGIGSKEPEIASGQVFLRSMRRGDWRAWAELREESRHFLTPWEPSWPEDSLSRSAYRRRLQRAHQDWLADRGYAFLIFRQEDARLVGGITLANVRRGIAQMGSIGYWIGLPFIRQGYVTDALRAMIDFSFDEITLHRLEAACLPHNEPSRRALLRVGFREEGLSRRYLKIDGRWQDHLRFGLIREDLRPE